MVGRRFCVTNMSISILLRGWRGMLRWWWCQQWLWLNPSNNMPKLTPCDMPSLSLLLSSWLSCHQVCVCSKEVCRKKQHCFRLWVVISKAWEEKTKTMKQPSPMPFFCFIEWKDMSFCSVEKHTVSVNLLLSFIMKRSVAVDILGLVWSVVRGSDFKQPTPFLTSLYLYGYFHWGTRKGKKKIIPPLLGPIVLDNG